MNVDSVLQIKEEYNDKQDCFQLAFFLIEIGENADMQFGCVGKRMLIYFLCSLT